jgi:hypothetical protein
MRPFKNLVFLLLSALILHQFLNLYGCANIIPPSGGPKDTIPPRLITVVPRDSALHFTGKLITFNFDEFVDLNNPIQNIIISPSPKRNPIVDHHLRTVTIRLKDTLLDNTTYLIDFGNTIKDINEGNILKHFSYVFSTGSYLDSMDLSGQVFVAETGKIDTTLIVMLHKNLDDSAVIKDLPRYVTRVDSLGQFHFRFLAPGTYNIYALEDQSGTRKYLSKSDLFAFYEHPITVGSGNLPLTLFAYPEENQTKKTTTSTTSTQPKKETKKEDKEKRLVVSVNLQNGQLDLLGDLIVQFKNGLKVFDSTKIHFLDGGFQPIKSYQLVKDSTDRILTFSTKWSLDSPYYLILEKSFGEDSSDRRLLKDDTIKFRTKKESDYGSLLLRFRNLDITKHPVLQFVQNKLIKNSFPLKGNQFEKKLFTPW